MVQIVNTLSGLSVGDVVVLKIGSPDLLVTGFENVEPTVPVPATTPGVSFVEAGPGVRVVWFNKDGGLATHVFPFAAVTGKAKGDGSPVALAPAAPPHA